MKNIQSKSIFQQPNQLVGTRFCSRQYVHSLNNLLHVFHLTIKIQHLALICSNTHINHIFSFPLYKYGPFDYLCKRKFPFSKLSFSSIVNESEEVLFLIKLFLSFFSVLNVKNGSSQNVILLIYCLAMVFLLYIYYEKGGKLFGPYKNIAESGIAIGLWLGICSLFQEIITPNENIGIGIAFLGTYFCAFYMVSLKVDPHASLLILSYKNISSSEEYLLYNYECIRLAMNYTPQNELLFEGILAYHTISCKKSVLMCPCLNIRNELIALGHDLDREDEIKRKKLCFQFIRQNILQIQQKYENVPDMSLLWAYIEKDQLFNKFKVLHLLEEPSHLSNGLKYRFLNYHCLRLMEKIMTNQDIYNNQKKSVDINRFIQFEQVLGRLQHKIEEVTYKRISFWGQLKTQHTNRQRIFKIGVDIGREQNKLDLIFNKMLTLNQSNIYGLMLYSNYMKVVANNSEVYEHFSSLIIRLKKNISNNHKASIQPDKQKYGENAVTSVIVISGQRKNIGTIKYCNTKVGQIIGYHPHELLGQNINILMPTFIGNMHDDVLRNYLELTQSKSDNVERVVPMINKSGFLVFGKVLTKPFCNLINGLELVGVFNLINESHLKHQGQIPNYVLYRTDSGQVEALSESVFRQYGHKISKIDEKNEISSQIVYSKLFKNAKEVELSEDKAIRCTIVTPQHKSFEICLYQRLKIYYYGICLKMLYFFPFKQPTTDFDTLKVLQQKKIVEKQQELSQSKVQRKDKVVKQKFFEEIGKKNLQNSSWPKKFTILVVFLVIALSLSAIIALTYTILDININEHLRNSNKIEYLTGSTVSEISQTIYNARMKHLYLSYPTILKNFSWYTENITSSLSSLQNGQFQISSLYLQAGGNNKIKTNQWRMNPNGQIVQSVNTISSVVFDLVIQASSLNQFNSSLFNFDYNLSVINGAISDPQMELFFLRNTGLFETIPKRLVHDEDVRQTFKSKIENYADQSIVKLVIISLLLAIILVVIIVLVISLRTFSNSLLSVFGYLPKSQVERQIMNYNSFLELFYQDSYLMQLKKKQTNQKGSMDMGSFGVEDVKLSSARKPNFKNCPIQLQSQIQGNVSINSSINKFDNLEKELYLRTEHEMLATHGNQEDNLAEQQALFASDENNIIEQFEEQSDKNKFWFVVLIVVLIGFILGYFIGFYFVTKQYHQRSLTQINNMKLIYQNLNAIKLLKLYSLETIINNHQFENYSTPNTTVWIYYNKIYEYQRQFDLIAELAHSEGLFQYYIDGICNRVNLLKKIKHQHHTSDSFSQNECQGLTNGVLKESLRLGIIGFTEAISNFTKNSSSISDLMNSPQFLEAHTMQKYLETPFLSYVQNINQFLQLHLSEKNESLIGFLLGFLFCLILTGILAWRPFFLSLLERVNNSKKILSYIPIRSFLKNAVLCQNYKSYIQDNKQ